MREEDGGIRERGKPSTAGLKESMTHAMIRFLEKELFVFPSAPLLRPSDEMLDGEKTPLLLSGSSGETRVYTRRWYMLTVLSAISFIQGCVWNNWGPIAPAVQPIFGWGSGTIALLANWVWGAHE